MVFLRQVDILKILWIGLAADYPKFSFINKISNIADENVYEALKSSLEESPTTHKTLAIESAKLFVDFEAAKLSSLNKKMSE